MKLLDDAVHSLVFQADFPLWPKAFAAIFGNANTGVYRLTPLDPECLEVFIAAARGLCFIGLIAFVAGVPTIALDYPIDSGTAQRLTTDFVSRFVRSLTACEHATDRRPFLPGGAVDFLDRLYQLPDERHAV